MIARVDGRGLRPLYSQTNFKEVDGMPRDTLAEFELLVILAALRLGPEEAYTVSIADVIESKTADLEGRLTVAEDTLARAHRAESLPEDAASRAKLADRLAVVEKALAKIRRNQKRKPLVPALST